MSKTTKEKNWKKENLLLQQQAADNLVLKEEINKEITIDNHIQVGFYQQVFKLKEDASLLTKKLEKQKHKNNELNIIIRHVRDCIDKEKGIPTSREKNNTDEQLDDYQRKLKRIETDLAQYSGKSNENAAKVTMKKLQINASRTQRVIDEGIFRNLEKELREKQFQFKKLLIEKINQRKKEEDIMNQYQTLADRLEEIKKNETATNRNEILSKKDGEYQNENYYKPNIDNKKFTMLKNSTSDRKLSFTLRKKQAEKRAQRTQHYEFLVKKAMIEAGCDNPCQLFQYLSSNNEQNKTKLQEHNSKLFEILNELEDKISGTKDKINETNEIKKSKKIMYYTKPRQPSKDEQRQKSFVINKNLLKQKQSQISSLEKEFKSFINQDQFCKMLERLSLNKIDSNNIESQNHKLEVLSVKLKQAEDVIQKYFCQACPQQTGIKNSYLSSMDQKENVHGLKKHKSQSLMSGSPEKLQQLLSKIKKVEQCDRILKKQQFRKQYKMLTKKSSPSFQNLPKIITKKNQQQRKTVQPRK